MPGCRPTTVPSTVPGSPGENAEVTSRPLSRTPTRCMAFVPALTRTGRLSPATNTGSGRLRLWIR
jgi:hypothetical protein